MQVWVDFPVQSGVIGEPHLQPGRSVISDGDLGHKADGRAAAEESGPLLQPRLPENTYPGRQPEADAFDLADEFRPEFEPLRRMRLETTGYVADRAPRTVLDNGRPKKIFVGQPFINRRDPRERCLHVLGLRALGDGSALLHLAELRIKQFVTSLVPLSFGLHNVLLVA
jgi:hypothetical protein